MKRFIFEERNGIYIIDLSKTTQMLEDACRFLHKTVLDGGKILWVGTKKQAQEAIRDAAVRTGMFFVTDRWVGGTLTNLVTIRRSVDRFQQLLKLQDSGELEKMPKKEVASIKRELVRLHKNLDGIVAMEKLPSALIVVDIKREENAVHEANRLGIPVVAIVDTNCDPELVQYPIPGNDDAIRSVKLLIQTLAEPVIEALVELGKSIPPPPAPAAPVPPEIPVAPTELPPAEPAVASV
jgi:small subunit ribosomal protein S2